MKDTKFSAPRVFGEEIHINAINLRIAGINREISNEMKRPSPDFLLLSKLKRQKLLLKDKARRVLKTRNFNYQRRSLVSSHLIVMGNRND